MPLIISDTINNFSESLISNSYINYIISNPICTALLISILCMILIVFIFNNSDIDNFSSKNMRLGFYIFMLSLGILFIYNKKLSKDMNEQYGNDDIDRVMSVVNGGYNNNHIHDDYNNKNYHSGQLVNSIYKEDIVPININTTFNHDSDSIFPNTTSYKLI
jgi:hypothetical protein